MPHLLFLWFRLIETRHRENCRFRDSDLLRFIQCRVASNFSDAELDTHFTQHTSFYLTSYVIDMNYITHQHFFVHLYQPIH